MNILLSSGIGFRTHTLAELEKLIMAEGYAGLELNMLPRNLPSSETKRDTAYEAVTSIKAIHAPSDLYDAPRFVSALNDTVTLAQQLNVPLINIHPAVLSVGGRENVIHGIELIKQKEEETGLTIAYEVLVDPNGLQSDRYEYFTSQQAYYSLEEYVADVKTYNLAATLDTTHIGTWKKVPHELITELGSNLKHVHISDYSSELKREHLLLGEGELDLVAFLNTLQEHNPDITITVELHPPTTKEEVEKAIKQSMEYITEALKSR